MPELNSDKLQVSEQRLLRLVTATPRWAGISQPFKRLSGVLGDTSFLIPRVEHATLLCRTRSSPVFQSFCSSPDTWDEHISFNVFFAQILAMN